MMKKRTTSAIRCIVAASIMATVITAGPSPAETAAESHRYDHLRQAYLSTSNIVAAADLTSDQIRDAVNRVMQQDDYRSVRRRVLENLPEDAASADEGFLSRVIRKTANAIGEFVEWIASGLFSQKKPQPANRPLRPQSSGPDLPSFSVGTMFFYLGMVVLILAVTWIIAAIVRQQSPKQETDHNDLLDDTQGVQNLAVPPGEQPVSTYESRAVDFARAGDYRRAIRELLIGAMSWIERSGMIRFRRGLTNRDYLRAVWRHEELRIAYATLAIEFERIYFGRRPATRETFEKCLKNFRESFREETANTAAV